MMSLPVGIEAAAKRRHAAAYAAVLAAIVVASLAFRIHVSKNCSLWLDEVWTLHDASAPLPELLRGPSREHPPLMFWFVRWSMDLFGTSETALRAPSLLFGCVLLVAVYFLCLELGYSRILGLLVVASFAFSPFVLRHGTEARHYAILPAFTTLATLFAFCLLRAPDDFGNLAGFAVSAAGAAATHYFGLAYAAALIGALVVGTLWPRRHALRSLRISRSRAIVLGLLALALAVVAWQELNLVRFYKTHRIGPQPHDLWSNILWEFSFLHQSQRAAKIEAFVAAAGLILLGLRLRGIARIIPFALAFAPCAGALLISTGHGVAPRYLAPSFVFYQLGAVVLPVEIALGVRRGGERFRLASILCGVAGGAALLFVLVVRLREYPLGYGAGRYYYAGLQRYFRDGQNRRTALIVSPQFPGQFIVESGYPVDVPVQALENFKPIPGVKSYLLAEFPPSSRERQIEIELGRRLHLSPHQVKKLPVVELEKTKFQPAVRARLIRVGR
jgi:4-amino-4-deoxy-L-arabinose transferase-like glycosyltransferase